MSEYAYTRYLAAKKSVDDRALNRNVLERLRRELGARRRLAVIEVGAGLGTMVARLIEWQLVAQADYHLLDVDARLLADSRAWLAEWARARGLAIDETGDGLRLRGGDGLDWTIYFIERELGAFLDGDANRMRSDLLVANAFLDLVDIDAMLPRLLGLLAPDGLYWLTINFDGETRFEPGDADDDEFMRVYHGSMGPRSRTGRRLFEALRRAGARILAAGASDWVVFADGGHYEADEARFLHDIIATVDAELKRHAEIDRGRLAGWVQRRREQIERGELVYVAHQLDFCGRRA